MALYGLSELELPKNGKILGLLCLKILAGVHQPCYSFPVLPPGASDRKGGTMHPWALLSSPGATQGSGDMWHWDTHPSPGWSRSRAGTAQAEGCSR